MKYLTTVIEYVQKLFETNIFVKIILWIPIFIVGYVWNSCDPKILQAIFALYCLDFILGFIKALKNKNVSSFRFFKGALKLVTYIVCLFVAALADNALINEIRSSLPNVFIPLMYSFIICTDGISVLENLSELGFNVPVKFTKYLAVYMEKQEKKIEDSLK